MAQEFTHGFYASKAWIKCRKAYTKKVGGLCENCLKKGLYVSGEIVHHKIHLTPDNINNPSITLAFDNLRLLCRQCHGEEHSKPRRYLFDDEGNIINKE